MEQEPYPEQRHYKITSAEARHNILKASTDQPKSRGSNDLFENDTTVITLTDYETNGGSKRNLYLVVNDIPNVGSHPINEVSGSKASKSSTSSREGSEKLDTIRSGESVIKYFDFDTSKYNANTDKCASFWRAVDQSGLKPVKCTLIKGQVSSDVIETGFQEEEEREANNRMWYKALVELQKKKMDEVAFAACYPKCRFCSCAEPYSEFKKKQDQKYPDSELENSEDLSHLNSWNPEPSATKPFQTLKEPLVPSQPKESDKQQNVQDEICRCDDEKTSHSLSSVEHRHSVDHSKDDQDTTAKESFGLDEQENDNASTGSSQYFRAIREKFTHKCACDEDDCECNETGGVRVQEEKVTKGILPNCDVCESVCKCWDHKVTMAKRFLDESKCVIQTKQDKACETERTPAAPTKKEKKLCVVCGHDDCGCNCPPRRPPHKYFHFFQLNDDLLSQQVKEKNVSKVQSLIATRVKSNAESVMQFLDESLLETGKDGGFNIEAVKKQISEDKKKKKLFVTPEDRAKKLGKKGPTVLKLDKYGIPQIVTNRRSENKRNLSRDSNEMLN